MRVKVKASPIGPGGESRRPSVRVQFLYLFAPLYQRAETYLRWNLEMDGHRCQHVLVHSPQRAGRQIGPIPGVAGRHKAALRSVYGGRAGFRARREASGSKGQYSGRVVYLGVMKPIDIGDQFACEADRHLESRSIVRRSRTESGSSSLSRPRRQGETRYVKL